MALAPIPEVDLYTALEYFRSDPVSFEAGVQHKLEVAETEQAGDPSSEYSPFFRIAAAFLPLPMLAGSKVSVSALKAVPLAGKCKLLGYVSLPAISLFVLIGSALFGAAFIQQVQQENVPSDLDQSETVAAGKLWWSHYKWQSFLFYAAVILLPMFGSTDLLFLLLLVSMGVLLLMVKALAKQGLGNRFFLGQSCLTGLILLSQVFISMPGIGDGSIHFFDQKLIGLVFFFGLIVLSFFCIPRPTVAWPKSLVCLAPAFLALPLVGMIYWFAKPTFFPLTPVQIKQFVESFDETSSASSSWRTWEKIARWTLQAGLDPNMSKPGRQLDEEIAGRQNDFILGSAFGADIVGSEQMFQLQDFEEAFSRLLGQRTRGKPRGEPRKIFGIARQVWVIHSAVRQELLAGEDCDYLQQRLLMTWEALAERPSLEDALYVVQLLEVIGRPMDRDRYQAQVHDWLHKFHSKYSGGFQIAGGFKLHPTEKVRVGNLRATWCAVELMSRFGIPNGLDMNWVRSFVKPMSMIRFGNERYLAAVIRDNMQRLPGIHQPIWLEYACYERSMIAAVMLVALCIYATLSSPLPSLPR